jgi:undecaprenyl-phosphate galactose phosphotransferase
MHKKGLSLLVLVLSDFLAVFASFSLAYILRDMLLPRLFPSLALRPVLFEIYWKHSYMFLVWFLVFLYEKLYTKRYSFWDEAQLLLKSSTISFSYIFIAVFITQQYFPFSRLILLTAWLVSPFLLAGFRLVAKRFLIQANLWRKRVILISSSNTWEKLIASVHGNRALGYEIVGCLSGDPRDFGKKVAGVEVLGHYRDLKTWKQKLRFEDIIVSLPDLSGDELVELLKQWEGLGETIRYIPRTGDLITTGVEIENIGKVLSLSLRKNLHKPWNSFIKNLFEWLLVLVLVLPLAPLFLVIAAAIKLDSRGPVFFLQERFGRRGRSIAVIKFRSMYLDSDQRLERHLRDDSRAREEWEQYKKLKGGDPRITRVGAFLRRFSLDELPQFLNVLRGDMSLVGPRPYIMEELKAVESLKSILLQVKPGITGLWQISGRSLVPFTERLNLDEYYLRNWSFWMDIVILIKTVRVCLSGKGAF